MSKSKRPSDPDDETKGLEARATTQDHVSLRVWLRFLSCSTEIEGEIRKRMRSQFGLSLAHFDYLAQLHRHPEGLSMRALAKYLMVTGPNVTGLTDELERAGFVSRSVPDDDRRSFRIDMTPGGRDKFDQVASVHESWIVEMFCGLRASDREKLNELLGELRVHLASVMRK